MNDEIIDTNSNSKKIQSLSTEIFKKNREIETLNDNIKSLNESHLDDIYLYESKLFIQSLFTEYHTETKSTVLKAKIINMKKMVQQLNEQYETNSKNREKKYQQKITEIVNNNTEIFNKNKELIIKVNEMNNIIENNNNNINKLQKEKSNMEDIIIRQEEKLGILVERVNQIEELLRKKNKILKENEAYAMELIKIVQKQKSEINDLRNKNYEKDISFMQINNNNKNNNNNSIINNSFMNQSNINNLNNNNNKNNNMNYDNLVLPAINNKLNTNTDNNYELNKKNEENDKKINEFKTMMNQLISEMEN